MGDITKVVIGSDGEAHMVDTTRMPSKQENEKSAADRSTYREGGAASQVRVSVNGDEQTVEYGRVYRATAAPSATRDPLDSGQNPHGGAVPRASITDETKIDFRGDRMPARALVAAGFLTKTVSGGYEWTQDGKAALGFDEAGTQDASPASANTDTTEQVTEDKPVEEPIAPDWKLSEESSRIVQRAGESVSHSLLDAYVSATIQFKDDLTRKMSNDIASQMGVEPQDANSMTAAVVADLTAQAKRVAASAGVDEDSWEAFTQDLWQDETNRLQIIEDFTNGRVTKLRNAAKAFATSGRGYDPDALASASFYINGKQVALPTRKEGSQVVVSLPDGRSATIAELLKEGKARVSRVK